MYAGWTQVAFDSELDGDVVPVDFAGRRLMAVRCATGLRTFDATCPHRGAHLGHGGKAQDGPGGLVVVCPFHGHRVHLGSEAGGLFRVNEHPSVHAARGLFVLSDPTCDTGLAGVLSELEHSHHIVEALTMRVAITPEYIIENAFDADHFAAVHAVERRPKLQISTEPGPVLRIDGALDMVRRNQWMTGEPDDTAIAARFVARLFSPMVVVSELGPADAPNVVITAATPDGDGGSVVRVTIGLPRHRASGPPTVREVASLISGSRTAFEQDVAVWEHLDTSVTPAYTEGDHLVRAYREHCERFRR